MTRLARRYPPFYMMPLLAVFQMLWCAAVPALVGARPTRAHPRRACRDRLEPSGYARAVSVEPLPNTPEHVWACARCQGTRVLIVF